MIEHLRKLRLFLTLALVGRNPNPLIFGTMALVWLGGGFALTYSFLQAPNILFASALLTWLLLSPPLLAHLLMATARWLMNNGMIALSSPITRLAIEIWRIYCIATGWVGLNLPSYLDLEGANALNLLQSSKYAEAEEEAREALKQKEASLGADSPDLCITIFALHTACMSTGKFGEAEQLVKRALRLTESPDLKNMFLRSSAWYVLGSVYLMVFELERCEECLLKAIEQLKLISISYPQISAVQITNRQYHLQLCALGDLYTYMNRFEEAEKLLIEGGSIDAELGPIEGISYLMRRGVLCIKQGKVEDAEKYLNAMNRQAKKYKTGFSNLRTEILKSQAMLAAAKKNFKESEKLFKSALTLSEEAFGKDHAQTAWMLYQYVDMLELCSRCDEATALRARADTIKASVQSNISKTNKTYDF
jgi:tetratricopeptide (TPR) repeat protein